MLITQSSSGKSNIYYYELEECDNPNLEFYREHLTFPVTPDKEFIGNNNDPYALMATQEFLKSKKLKVNDLNVFFTHKKRIDNIAALSQSGIQTTYPEINDFKIRAIRSRFLKTQQWDNFFRQPQAYRSASKLPHTWEIFYECTKDIEKTTYLCVWFFYRLGSSIEDTKWLNKVLYPELYEDIEKIGLPVYLDRIATLKSISYSYFNNSEDNKLFNYSKVALNQEITPELTKLIIKHDRKGLNRLAAISEFGITDIKEVAKMITEMPEEWATALNG